MASVFDKVFAYKQPEEQKPTVAPAPAPPKEEPPVNVPRTIGNLKVMGDIQIKFDPNVPGSPEVVKNAPGPMAQQGTAQAMQPVEKFIK